MNRFSEIVPLEHVLAGVSASSKKAAFDMAAQLFARSLGLDSGAITDSLLARESLGSTGLGAGVAIPHARIKGLSAPTAAILQLQHPIAFNAPDQSPVSLLIFLLVPEAATQQHLQLLSTIAELLNDDARRTAMKTCTSAPSLLNLASAPSQAN